MLGKISPPRVMYGLHTLGSVGNQQPQYPPILRDQGCAAGDENQPCPVQIENCITLRGAAPEVKHIPSHPLLVWTWIQTFTLTEISSAWLLLYCFIVLREVAVNLYSIYKLRWEKYFGPICWIVCGWRLVSKFKTGLDSNRATKLNKWHAYLLSFLKHLKLIINLMWPLVTICSQSMIFLRCLAALASCL